MAGLAFKLAAGLAAVALAVQAGAAWQHEQAAGAAARQFGEPGSRLAVTLANGQVYYGELVQARAQALSLAEVYYVQSVVTNAETHQTDNRLVNRARTDWHGPRGMTIPMDKVLMVEPVDPDSRLGRLIAQDRQAAPASAAH